MSAIEWKPICGCPGRSCRHWARLQEANKVEEQLAKMWEKAAVLRTEARQSWYDHLADVARRAA